MSAKVIVTSRSFSTGDWDGIAELHTAGATVVVSATDHDYATLAEDLDGAVAWIAGTAPITEALFAIAPRLRLVARYGVGVEAVDLDAARSHGVAVTNTPGVNSDAVSDHALALTLAALRGIASGDRLVRAGDWAVSRTREVSSLTVGILGAGRIGRGYGSRMAALGATVLACDPILGDAGIRALGFEPADLGSLAERVNVLSLHAPGDAVVIDEAWLAATRHVPIIVNTARAVLVDEFAVAKALRSGSISSYAADTLSSEKGGASPLLAADLTDITVFTPHCAAQTVEAVDGMTRGAVEAVLALLAGEHLPNVVVPTPDSQEVTK